MIWDDNNILFGKNGKGNKKEDTSEQVKKNSRRSTEVYELSPKYEYRRAFSETKLLDAIKEFKFENGKSYNFITGGDVDSLSYLKAIIRAQHINYCLLSTWCMAAEDVFQLKEWMEQGKIDHLDCYLGEIFPSSYRIEYKMMKELMQHYNGRLVIFRNHSKIYAGYGDKFPFAIQTSANINTNPRTEQGNITIDQGLYEFYREYFDGIKSFVKDGE